MTQTDEHDIHAVWERLVNDLPANERAWLSASRPVSLHESHAIIAVSDDFSRSRIEGRLRTRLEDILSHAYGTSIRIVCTVDSSLRPSDDLTQLVMALDSGRIKFRRFLILAEGLAGSNQIISKMCRVRRDTLWFDNDVCAIIYSPVSFG